MLGSLGNQREEGERPESDLIWENCVMIDCIDKFYVKIFQLFNFGGF